MPVTLEQRQDLLPNLLVVRTRVLDESLTFRGRQIKGGGLRVNDAPVTDEKMALSAANLTPEGVIKLSFGKKKHVLLRPA